MSYYFDDEESISDCYDQNKSDNNNNNDHDDDDDKKEEDEEDEDEEEEGINNENADHNDSHQDVESKSGQLNNAKHQNDYNTDDSSSLSDSSYQGSDDEEREEEGGDEEECIGNKNQDHPFHPCAQVITSSCGEDHQVGELSQHNQDTIVAERIESITLLLQQWNTIHTTVARLPSGEEANHQALLGVSRLDSVSLWLQNRQSTQLYLLVL